MRPGFAAFLLLLASSQILAQQTPKQTPKAPSTAKRIVTIAGRASDNGSIILRNSDGKVWSIRNPEMLKGHEGLPVVIQGQLEPNKNNELNILTVKTGRSETQYRTTWDDSAFRR